MEGWKLLVVQPLMADGRTPDGDPLLAVDRLGAGRGRAVMITSDGKGTRELLKSDNDAGALERDWESRLSEATSDQVANVVMSNSADQIERIVGEVLARLGMPRRSC